jgi:hypothetical protein
MRASRNLESGDLTKISYRLRGPVGSSSGRIFVSDANPLNLRCGAKTPLWAGIQNRTGAPDMPKTRVAVLFRTSAVSSVQSEANQFVTIALFSGIGLLLSLIAILAGMPIVGD